MVEHRKEGRADQRPTDEPSAERGAARDRTAPECDSADFGQPAGSPGGRGGAIPYGGVKRMEPRNRS